MLSAYQIRKVIRVYCEKLKEKDVSGHLFSDLEKRMSSAITQSLIRQIDLPLHEWNVQVVLKVTKNNFLFLFVPLL